MRLEMEKLEYKALYKGLISPKRTSEIVQVPAMQFLMVDGIGDPNGSSEFADAISALYGIAYGIKFGRKKSGETPDFSLGPIEALWSANGALQIADRATWQWTLMLWVPEFLTPESVGLRIAELIEKKPNPALKSVSLQTLEEGTSVQVMHIGPYSDEWPTIDAMHKFALEQGYRLEGKHHELYFSDPRRTAPEKLKTILRQPIRSTQ
jgi:hypothetical protein